MFGKCHEAAVRTHLRMLQGAAQIPKIGHRNRAFRPGVRVGPAWFSFASVETLGDHEDRLSLVGGGAMLNERGCPMACIGCIPGNVMPPRMPGPMNAIARVSSVKRRAFRSTAQTRLDQRSVPLCPATLFKQGSKKLNPLLC